MLLATLGAKALVIIQVVDLSLNIPQGLKEKFGCKLSPRLSFLKLNTGTALLQVLIVIVPKLPILCLNNYVYILLFSMSNPYTLSKLKDMYMSRRGVCFLAEMLAEMH